MARRILVVSAHIGDEILGCGGTMLLHAQQGDHISVVVLGEGWTSRTQSLRKGLEAVDLDAFEAQARRALAEISVSEMHFHRLPDNRFDRLPFLDIVKIVERHKRLLQPEIIYTNTAADLGVDQRITCQAVMTAFRPQPDEKFAEVLAFEVKASTEWRVAALEGFRADRFVDISGTLDKKVQAVQALGTELRPWPHARSVESVCHHAHACGASVGLGAAEAFSVLRSIHRVN